jgi:hypothetical protein
MKCLIVAVSFVAVAVPALADTGAPFEQTQLDRMLPELEGQPVRYAMSADGVISDRSIATDRDSNGVWANDHNFIAPPQ